MKQGKMSEPRLSGLNDEQDLGTQKIRKSLNQANPDADNSKQGNAPSLPKGWEIKKLGEVCEISTGKSNTEDAIENGEYAFFDRSKIVKRSSKFLFDCDAIIVAGEGQTFLPKFYSGKFDLHQRAYAIYNFDKRVSVHYAYKYLIHFHKYFENVAVGATAKSLRLRHFQDLPIPIPPLPEQQRIVSILDDCFAAIDKAKANAEQNLKNAKELFESYLQGVFEKKGEGWEIKKLGEIAFVKSGGTPLRHKTEYWNGDIAWYSSGELNNLYTTEPERHINELAIENSNAKLFPKGSLLIGMYDTAALKMSILDRDGTFNQAIAGVKPNPKIDLIFILYAINAIKSDLLNLRRGVRQKNLSLEKIKNIPIPFPPLKAQQTIVRQLDALRAETQKLEAVYQKKIADLEELKKSILQKAFAGELKTEKAVIV
jgi:type I restriction enzyme S subunit